MKRVLLMASYCEDIGCTDDLPCEDCLKMSNVIVVNELDIVNNLGGWDYLREHGKAGCE